MIKVTFLLLFWFLSVGLVRATVQDHKELEDTSDCAAKLEQAEIFEMANDARAEAEFRSVVRTKGNHCPDAFLKLSQNLSRNLKLREAAEMLDVYVKIVPAKRRGYDKTDVRDLLHAARVQRRVSETAKPPLKDLLQLTHLVEGYGRGQADDAMPYAEKALRLYPDSVSAMLLVVDLLLPAHKDKDRVEELLIRAAAIEPREARTYASRGWFYLWERGNSALAEKDFRLALSLSKNRNTLAWKGLGYALMQRGQKREAIAAFRSYLRLSHGTAHASEVIDFIDQMEKNP
jgi:tetratricopeptide (TPR) repeat protein